MKLLAFSYNYRKRSSTCPIILLLCVKPLKITKFGSLNVNMSSSLEFNVWSGWRNRNGNGYIRNRTCEKNDGESKVKVNSAKCNGSDFESIGNTA